MLLPQVLEPRLRYLPGYQIWSPENPKTLLPRWNVLTRNGTFKVEIGNPQTRTNLLIGHDCVVLRSPDGNPRGYQICSSQDSTSPGSTHLPASLALLMPTGTGMHINHFFKV